jgi:hypothetical protein
MSASAWAGSAPTASGDGSSATTRRVPIVIVVSSERGEDTSSSRGGHEARVGERRPPPRTMLHAAVDGAPARSPRPRVSRRGAARSASRRRRAARAHGPSSPSGFSRSARSCDRPAIRFIASSAVRETTRSTHVGARGMRAAASASGEAAQCGPLHGAPPPDEAHEGRRTGSFEAAQMSADTFLARL